MLFNNRLGGPQSSLGAFREQLDPARTYQLFTRAYSFSCAPLGAPVEMPSLSI